MLKDDVLQELENNRHTYLSGQELADRYGVSRNAVWKAINALKKQGYGIDSVTNRGYILCDDAGVLSGAGIMSRLNDNCKDLEIYVHDVIDSTNNEAKRMLASDCELGNSLIVCNEQSNGRGRYGREFESPRGNGIYMTIVYKLPTPITDAHYINQITAEALESAIDSSLNISIRIDDDGGVFYSKHKIGGILIEAVTGLDSGYHGHIIAGIGINMTEELAGSQFHRNELIATITGSIIDVYQSVVSF